MNLKDYLILANNIVNEEEEILDILSSKDYSNKLYNHKSRLSVLRDEFAKARLF